MTTFISHSSKNNDFLNQIVDNFKQYNIEYWISEDRIKPNERTVYAKMRSQVNRCSKFILLWSIEASKSFYVRDEINWITEDKNKKIDLFVIIIEKKNTPPLPAHFEDPFYFKVKLANSKQMDNTLRTIISHICTPSIK